jgi:hypothetical protein
LKITGFALAQWTQSESTGVGKNRRQRSVRYTGREDYLNSTTYLTGSNEGHQVEILPGIHTYNFSCFLPATLPTSFEGTYGHIRYTVRVGLERPWKFDQTYKVAFTVLKLVSCFTSFTKTIFVSRFFHSLDTLISTMTLQHYAYLAKWKW